MASKAMSFQFLLSQVRNITGALNGGTATFYEAGTTTPKTIWLDRDKAAEAANPFDLDANGTAQLFGDGIYDILIKNSAGSTIYTREGISAVDLLSAGVERQNSDFASLNQAISEIGATPTTLNISTADFTMTGHATVPATLTLKMTYPGSIDQDVYTLTVNSSFDALAYQVFNGPVLGLTTARPEWWGTGTDALNSAITTGAEVILQQGSYTLGAAATLGTGQVIRGAGKTVTTIVKGFNGDSITMGEGAGLVELTLDGEGATYTGRNIVISGTNGRQYGTNCRIIDSDGYAIEYTASTAGSQDSWVGCHIARYNGTAAGRYAVKISDTAAVSAVPHKYVNIETDGGLFIDFGGCDNVFISNSYVGGFLYTTNSRSTHISNCRIRGTAGDTLEIKGSGHTIIGSVIFPEVILASGTNSNKLRGNGYNNGVTDNANSPTNEYDTPTLTYDPEITTTGDPFDIGDGTLTGTYRHQGTKWVADITLTFGSTTTAGTGIYSFSVPTTATFARAYGIVRLFDSSESLTVAARAVLTSGAYRIQYDNFVSVVSPIAAIGGGTVQATTPWTWGDGDVISIHVEYND